MKVVVLASVPHTGTFFVENFLRNHKSVGHSLGVGPVLKSRCLVRRRLGEKAWEEGLEPGSVNVMQAHLTPYNLKYIQAFALFNPLVIPMRDPLLAMVSTVARNPDNDPMKQVDAFVDLAEAIVSHQHIYQPYFVPVDLLQEEKSGHRYNALASLQTHCGLAVDKDHTALVATRWEPVNSAALYPLKKDYLNRDKKSLWKALGREISAMQAREGVLRPMLEKIGYKDLIWYS